MSNIDQNSNMSLLIVAVCTIFQKLYMVLGKKSLQVKEYDSIFPKYLKTISNSPEQSAELTQR